MRPDKSLTRKLDSSLQEIAEEEVKMVGGPGFVRLGDWLHQRHKKYISFIHFRINYFS